MQLRIPTIEMFHSWMEAANQRRKSHRAGNIRSSSGRVAGRRREWAAVKIQNLEGQSLIGDRRGYSSLRREQALEGPRFMGTRSQRACMMIKSAERSSVKTKPSGAAMIPPLSLVNK